MEKRQRVILYGKSVILGSVGASLRDVPGLEILPVAPPLPEGKGLQALAPDAIIFDLEAAHPDAALSLLRQRPDLLLVGVDPASDELVIVSSRQRRAVAVGDLLRVIHWEEMEGEGDAERGRHGGTEIGRCGVDEPTEALEI